MQTFGRPYLTVHLKQCPVVPVRIALGKHHPPAFIFRGKKKIPDRLPVRRLSSVHGNFSSDNHGIAPSMRRNGHQLHVWKNCGYVQRLHGLTGPIVCHTLRHVLWTPACVVLDQPCTERLAPLIRYFRKMQVDAAGEYHYEEHASYDRLPARQFQTDFRHCSSSHRKFPVQHTFSRISETLGYPSRNRGFKKSTGVAFKFGELRSTEHRVHKKSNALSRLTGVVRMK